MIIQASTTQIASAHSATASSFTISGSKDNQQGTSSTSSQSDSVVISAQGMAMFAESQQLGSSVLDAIKKEAATSSTTNELLTSTTDLSSYSDSQLKQLVADGTISQSEATAELTKRAGNSDTMQNSAALISSTTHIDALV